LHEAVVEEEPEQGGADPSLVADGLGHGRPHDALQVGAGGRVEGRRELRVGGQGEEGDGEQPLDQGRTPSRHGNLCCCLLAQ